MAANRQVYNFGDILREGNRMRYVPESFLGEFFHDNKFIDKFLGDRDAYMNWSPQEIHSLRFINPNIATIDENIQMGKSDLWKDPLHFTNSIVQKIIRELDLTPTKQDFQLIRDMQLKIASVGYGGAMVNLFHNVTLWSVKLRETEIFDRLVFFDKDKIAFSNMMRFLKPIALNYTKHCAESGYNSEYNDSGRQNSSRLEGISKVYTVSNEELISPKKIFIFELFVTEENVDKLESRGYTLIGAPTLETRQLLQDKDFYFMGHGGTKTALVYQPVVDTNFTIETYGTIDIPILAINLSINTCAWLKHLARERSLGLSQDKELFKFDAVEYIKDNPHILENYSDNIFEDERYTEWTKEFHEHINSDYVLDGPIETRNNW